METNNLSSKIYNLGNLILAWRKARKGKITKEKLLESFQGWQAHAKWADSFNLRNTFKFQINQNP